MPRSILFAPLLLVVYAPVLAADAGPGFAAAEPGYFAFDTGSLRGQFRADGRSQGLSSVVDAASGMEIVRSPGLLSYYRVFSNGARYGDAARDWPLSARLLDDGAVEIRFPSADEHPIEITGQFRWRSSDTLDLLTTVTAQKAMPGLEVFLSSYFVQGFDAWVYLRPNRFQKGPPALVRPDWSALIDGSYLMFPHRREGLLMIHDGRWEIPPAPVTWAFTRYLEAPIAVRRHAESGLTAVLMAAPEDCFAVGTPYNQDPPDRVAAHWSLYLSLFGRDVEAGEPATAHTRLIIARDLSDEAIVERYRQYLAEREGTPAPAK